MCSGPYLASAVLAALFADCAASFSALITICFGMFTVHLWLAMGTYLVVVVRGFAHLDSRMLRLICKGEMLWLREER